MGLLLAGFGWFAAKDVVAALVDVVVLSGCWRIAGARAQIKA
jgi:hypothetical protein